MCKENEENSAVIKSGAFALMFLLTTALTEIGTVARMDRQSIERCAAAVAESVMNVSTTSDNSRTNSLGEVIEKK